MTTKTYRPRHRRANGFFAPAFENILHEMMNTSVKDIVTQKNTDFTQPAANVHQSDEGYSLELALPGLSKEDVEIKVDKDVLIISAAKEADTEKNYRIREFKYGTFERRFRLNDTIDQSSIKASFANGVLTISMDKAEVPQPQSISIK